MATKPTGGTDTQIKLGKLFRSAREAAKVSLRDACSALGMSINTIRWHEAGSRCIRADDLVAAARLFGCSPGYLLDGQVIAEENVTEDTEDDGDD